MCGLVGYIDKKSKKTPFNCRKEPVFQQYFDILWKEIDNYDIG